MLANVMLGLQLGRLQLLNCIECQRMINTGLCVFRFASWQSIAFELA